MSVLVTCRKLEVGYRGKAMLPPVELEIERGRLLLVLGRNGSGKSTLVRTVLGLIPPVRGEVAWAPGAKRAYVPQTGTIDPGVPIRAGDVVEWGRVRGWDFLWPFPRRGDAEIRDRALAALQVGHLARRRLRELSGGQVQRVLFAQMLAAEAEVCFLDEPTASMDPTGERAVYATLRGLARERGLAVVVVTHSISAALGACDEVLLIDPDGAPGGKGRIVLGAPDTVGEDPAFHALFGVAVRPDRVDA